MEATVTQVPSKEEMDEITSKRPGDQVYGSVRPDVERLHGQAGQFKQTLVEILTKDSAWDKALSVALDHFGAVLEYQGHEDGTAPPAFDGTALMTIFSRLSRFKFVVEVSKAIGLEGEALAMAMRAEAERIWEKPRIPVPSPGAKVDPGVTPEMNQMLGAMARYMREHK